MSQQRAHLVRIVSLAALLTCGLALPSVAPVGTPLPSPGGAGVAEGREHIAGSDYANPTEIGLYTLAFVGKSGRTLLALYHKMGQETGHWPGIEFLPDDIQMCDEISITRAP